VRTPSRLAVAATLVVVATACSGSEVFSLEVGQCFQLPEGEPEQVTDVEVVDCDQPHENEVFHTFELEGERFPGQEAATAAAEEACYGAAFEDYIGQPYETSQVEVFSITPTRTSWEEADDREVVCAVWIPEEQVEGSLQGSGR
jgi:hypothetical protein